MDFSDNEIFSPGIGFPDVGEALHAPSDAFSGIGDSLSEATNFEKFDADISKLNFGGMRDASTNFKESFTGGIEVIKENLGELTPPSISDIASNVSDAVGLS